jgi:glutamate---cysteine ligase / carboxylate-amine ligase
MTLDLGSAREAFETSTDGTVGLEEEFAILDASTLGLAGRYDELRASADDDPVLVDAVAPDLIRSEIEIRSGRGEDLADAAARQRHARRALFRVAAEHGVALGSTGTHPWSDYREQAFIDTEHYRRVAGELQYVARRNNTFSLHVHVGVQGADRAVRVADRLRPMLPVLLAISANSPYLDGLDSGLHSARTQSFTKSFPRCGVPDVYGSWETYAEYIDFLSRTGSIVEYTQVWWSVRPHFSFGTVEVRICDAQATAGESDGLAALMVACVLQAARDEDEGRPDPRWPGRLIEENMWRAIRFGLDGELLDFERREGYPAASAPDRLLEWTRPVCAEHGIEPALPELNGAQRQRRMIDAGASMEEVFAASVKETRVTYDEEAGTAGHTLGDMTGGRT